MRKLLITLMLLLFALPLFGADAYFSWWIGDSSKIGVGCQEVGWHFLLLDTITFHVKNGVDTIDLGTDYWNFYFLSLNASTDSGYIILTYDAVKSIDHTAATARALKADTIGLDSGNDAFYIGSGFGLRKFYVTPKKGGTADSTCKVIIKAVR